MKLYTQTFASTKKGDLTTDTLYRDYSVIQGWEVLEGKHHPFRNEKTSPSHVEKNQPYSHMGITDLKAKIRLSKTEPEEYDLFWCELQDEVLSGDHTNLVLEIDVSYPIPGIIRASRPPRLTSWGSWCVWTIKPTCQAQIFGHHLTAARQRKRQRTR